MKLISLDFGKDKASTFCQWKLHKITNLYIKLIVKNRELQCKSNYKWWIIKEVAFISSWRFRFSLNRWWCFLHLTIFCSSCAHRLLASEEVLADIFFSSSEFHLCVHSLTFALHGIPSHPRKVSRNKSEFGQSKVRKKERKNVYN